MEPTPNASLVALKELAQRATKGPWRSSGSSIEADSLYRLAYTNSFHADWRQNADYIAAASPDVVLGLLQQLAAADAASHQLRSEACGLHAELSDLRKYKTNQEWLAQMRAGYPQKAASEAADALATQLAAAEARATEAAAEAGKWQQRHGELQQELAEQEVQTLALVQEAQRNREWHLQRMAAVDDRANQDVDSESFGNGVFWYIGYDKGNYTTPAPSSPAALWPAAPAPVAPQQQEGGGQ